MACSNIPLLRVVIHAFKTGGLSKREEIVLDTIFTFIGLAIAVKIAGLV